MGDLTLYTNPMSRGRIARWMLEEIGVHYDAEIVEYGKPMHGPAYAAINPMRKVPALRHGEAIVTECGAICTYLAEAFPEAELAPAPGTEARASFYRWMFFGAGPLEAAVTNAAMGWQVDEPQQQGRLGYGSLQRVQDTLEGWLDGRDYFLGDTFSAVDVYVGAQIAFGLQFDTLEARPVFTAYAERMLSRKAAKRAQEIDDALLPDRTG